MKRYTLRQKAGALLLDWPPFEWRLRVDPLTIRNRRERLEPSPGRDGFRCLWQWTRDLRVCKMYPSLGRRLMRRMLALWPVGLAGAPQPVTAPPQVSFIIGHRGTARLPHLRTTLSSIAAQSGVAFECLVIEQSEAPEVRDEVPAWVRYCHTPLAFPGMPYSRSWAFNVGARMARGELLVLHDNDLPVPRKYAGETWRRFREGYEVINLKRFIFYLGEETTARFMMSGGPFPDLAGSPLAIMQNAEGGGSLAVGRKAFLELGGFDEAFVGWGGEDNEFWERCRTRSLWPFGYLPLLHLWHEPQPEKAKVVPERLNQKLLDRRSALPVECRIRELAAREFGNPERIGP